MPINYAFILFSALCLFCNPGAYADTPQAIDISVNYGALGEHTVYLAEAEQLLTITDARKAYESGQFLKSNKSVLSTGIGASPIWVSFSITNKTPNEVKRRLIIETPWLDLAEFYVISNGNLVNRQQTGDQYPFSERSIKHRHLAFDYNYPPGLSQIFIRAETPDPMVLPIFFNALETASAHDVNNAYSYGILYGIIIALLLYNLLLYLSIHQSRYLYYVIYLSMFLLMNASYTGHGYALFWPDSVWLQRWINPFSITLFSTSGIAFAFSFLNIKKLFPRLYYRTIAFCVIFWLLQILFMLANMQTAAVATAIAFVMFFSLFTFYAAIISLHRGHNDAIYYLIATIATLFGTAITALAVWAVIPFTTLTYRAAEIAVSIDALLLSIALAEQIRRAQKEKLQAQQLSRIDMLTGLYNRRAFYEISSPIWHNAIRHNHETCIMLLDIDEFKLINDSYGHAAGDLVLKAIADTLNKVIREGDILARWGGEEFVIMLPQTSLEQAEQLAERIRQSISDVQIRSDSSEISTTVSLGVAQKESNTKNIEELFKIADRQLYQAKQSGRNKVCIDFSANS